jgi:hypothetical protein
LIQKRHARGDSNNSNSSLSRIRLSSLHGSAKSLDDFFQDKETTKNATIMNTTPINSSIIRRKKEIEQSSLKLPRKDINEVLTFLNFDQTKPEIIDGRKQKLKEYRMKKFNSTSTIFVDNVILNPNFLEYLKYLTNFIHNLLKKSTKCDSNSLAQTHKILSEKTYPLSVLFLLIEKCIIL